MFTDQMVHNALQTWCDNVVAAGKTYREGKDVRAFASKVLSENYDYDNGKVTLSNSTHKFCQSQVEVTGFRQT